MRSVCYIAVIMLMAFVSPVRAGNKDFAAQFNKCEEFVGIGLVPASRARPLVPASYTLAGDANNALLVVRVVSCTEVSVDGKKAEPVRSAQIGVMLQVSDSSADIDNYLLWFATNSGNLHGKLNAAGIKTSNAGQLNFAWTPSGAQGPLQIDVSAADFPTLSMRGNAQAPNSAPQGFVADWVQNGKHGNLLMHTSFQTLSFGQADLVLTPQAGSELAQLIGAASMTFSVLNSHNTWQTAAMQATLH